MGNPREPLEPDGIYHIYNHAVGKDNLFREPRNYPFFMGKFEKWIVPVCDVLAYCLMPNHFHFAVRVKSVEVLEQIFEEKIKKRASAFVIQQYSNCFNSYVQAYNKIYLRMGSLMTESFKRKKVGSDEHLKTLICYIHNNPVKHGFVKKPDDWKHSSYPGIVGNTPSFVKRHEVIELFDSLENLVFVHCLNLGRDSEI
jgi:REP element-mobilizing transposase RayT